MSARRYPHSPPAYTFQFRLAHYPDLPVLPALVVERRLVAPCRRDARNLRSHVRLQQREHLGRQLHFRSLNPLAIPGDLTPASTPQISFEEW